MIKFIKKHKILSVILSLLTLINIFVATLALIPANKDVTTPGGFNEVKKVISVENETKINGSFNTIYVYSLERVSVLQSLIASLTAENDVSDSSDLFHLTDSERRKAGEVQKRQSIEASLICAYDNAKSNYDDSINLTYSFTGLIVRNYQVKHTEFKIGDLIVKIIDGKTYQTYDITDKEFLIEKVNNLNVGDTLCYYRDKEYKEFKLDKELDYYINQNMFYLYEKYEIIEENAKPKYSVYKTNTLGPSGGLLQTLAIYSQLINKDLTYGKKIAGTGTISVNGKVGAIGGVGQKVVTAIREGANVFLCPKDNFVEAYEMYIKIPNHEKMHLICVETFEDALYELGELYEK